MIKTFRLALAVALLCGILGRAKAQETNAWEVIKQLQKRIAELEEKVKNLEQSRISEITNARARPGPEKEVGQGQKVPERGGEFTTQTERPTAKEPPKVSVGEGGVLFSSADDNFKLKVRGYIQADGRFYFDDTKNSFTDTFLLNRVRPVFEATVFKNYDVKLMPDFGQGRALIYDAYADAHFLPWLNVRAGKSKSLIGLERLQSARDLIFVERALPTDLVPNRDIGIALHGEFIDGVLAYDAGVFNGSNDGTSNDADENDSKDVAGRLFVQPFKKGGFAPLEGVGIGIAGSTGHASGSAPAYKTVGQQTFFSFNSGVTAKGERQRVSPQGYYYWGPFGVLAEYVLSSQEINKGMTTERLENSAWQVAASFVLTGEKASYTGVAPRKPFNWREGQWGAFEIAARVSQLSIDQAAFHNFGTIANPDYLADPDKSASEATSWGVGLNWYLNKNLKFQTDYEHTRFNGGAPAGDRQDEQVLFGRIQIAF